MKPAGICFIGLFYLLLVCAGCEKGFLKNNDEAENNIILPRQTPYLCSACVGADNFTENKWSFYNIDTFYCGIIDTAIALPERTGFTIFGPSSCSPDSGLILTINISPANLTKDIFNLTTLKAGMYYYDNVSGVHPFISQPGNDFSFIIDSYIYQTRMMTGRFSGTVFTPNGQATTLFGKYKVRVI